MALFKRAAKPVVSPAPSAFTLAVDICDKPGCSSIPTHHISWQTHNIGRTHSFLCDLHYAAWHMRQGAKKGRGKKV